MRFAFGKNWQNYSARINDERIKYAEDHLREMLGVNELHGHTFVDAGCGSGLFSLAAIRLGAAQVHSFDYDSDSVECTRTLKRQYACTAAHWTIERGDVLDLNYLEGLGTYDIVYSWGVLHHTGDMWRALNQVTSLVREPNGILFIAIYNDQGWKSSVWKLVKRAYNMCAAPIQIVARAAYFAAYVAGVFGLDLVRRRDPRARYKGGRGMSIWYDVHDWFGGYPFEWAGTNEIVRFYEQRRFKAQLVRGVGRRSGCNQYVFQRATAIRSGSEIAQVKLQPSSPHPA